MRAEMLEVGKPVQDKVNQMRQGLAAALQAKGGEETLLQGEASEYEQCLAFDLDKLIGLLDKDLVLRRDQFDKAKQAKVAAKSALENLLAEQQKMLTEFVKQYQTGTIPAKPFTPQLMKLAVFGDKTIKPDIQFPTQKDLESFPLTRRIKLQKISF